MSRLRPFNILAAATLCLLAGCADNEAQQCAGTPAATGGDAIRPSLVRIPAGRQLVGADNIYPEEAPRRTVQSEGFWIGRHEVTNRQFKAFIDATGYVTTAERTGTNAQALPLGGGAVFTMPQGGKPGAWTYDATANWRQPFGAGSTIEGREDWPVVQVSRQDASAYAAWLGARLPTDEEWEYAAASGGNNKDIQGANSWQGLFPDFNTADDGWAGAAPVGCYAPDQNGAYDMIGNVWEWTASAYAETGAPAGQYTIKGGSYLCAENYCFRARPSARQGQDNDFSTSHIGFRVVRD